MALEGREWEARTSPNEIDSERITAESVPKLFQGTGGGMGVRSAGV